MPIINSESPSWVSEVKEKTLISTPTFDDSSVSSNQQGWNKAKASMQRGLNSGQRCNIPVQYAHPTTYFTSSFRNPRGSVLAPNGEIHFIIPEGLQGLKFNITNQIFTTYTLLYSTVFGYAGGVLAPDGSIHYIPNRSNVGQKILPNGVVETYSLAFTWGSANVGQGCGGVTPDGSIHLGFKDSVGQRILPNGTMQTYPLAWTILINSYYQGSVLDSNGDLHLVPYSSPRAQKIKSSLIGVTVSTYPLVYTTTLAYFGGVLAPNGEIHFVPTRANVGQKVKVDSAGGVTVSTYSLAHTAVYTVNGAYRGGVLAPNGEIHFIPWASTVGQKVKTDSAGGVTVSTYPLTALNDGSFSDGFNGGILGPNETIYFIPNSSGTRQLYALRVNSGYNFDNGLIYSPYLRNPNS